MIFIRIELWPSGDETKKRILGEAVIINTTTGTAESGNYECIFSKFGGFGPRHGKVWRRGKVNNFPRKKLGPWDLFRRAIDSIRNNY